MIQARLKLGQTFLPEEKVSLSTLDKYFKRFQETYLETAVRRSTKVSYESSFRLYLLPELGQLKLDEISRDKILDLIATLVKRNFSKDTIRLVLAALRCVLNHAQETGLIVANPATKLGKFYKQAKRVHEEIEPLSSTEVPVFFATVLKEFPDHYPLFLCAIHTGLRSGELAGLQWGDIDFNGKFLTVRRNVVQGRVNRTKTDKTRRVDLSDEVLATFHDLLRRKKEERMARGKNEIPDWVFANSNENAPDMQNIKNHYFFKCLQRAGLRRIRFHDLRHTFASLLIQNGEPLAYVKDQLGHASIKMTVDVYGHLVPGANRQAVNRLPLPSSVFSERAIQDEAHQKKFVPNPHPRRT
jgi:integrase